MNCNKNSQRKCLILDKLDNCDLLCVICVGGTMYFQYACFSVFHCCILMVSLTCAVI